MAQSEQLAAAAHPISIRIKIAVGTCIAEGLYRLLRLWPEPARTLDQLQQTASPDPKETLLRQILRSHPVWARGHLILGDILLERKNPRGAWACALAAVELLGTAHPQPAVLSARVYLHSGRTAEAMEAFEALSERYPSSPEIMENLAAGYMQQGQNQRALELLSAIPQDRRTPSAHAALLYLVGKNQEH